VLKRSYELSSMGIRVDQETLMRQLTLRHELHRLSLPWHQSLMAGKLPLSIGGGIGQSRLCMLFLQKAHIGEIQASIWPPEMAERCLQHNIPLL
jgi:aspartate--ammonia ligase